MPFFFILCCVFSLNILNAQAGGNITYSRQNQSTPKVPLSGELSDKEGMFLEANVMMNVFADDYVALFALSQEAKTLQECSQKMDQKINDFLGALKEKEIPSEQIFVDFVGQNRIYDYEITNQIAIEKLVGFELKKNIFIQYSDRFFIDELTLIAARFEIFDLVKVDYVVKDISAIQSKLFEEAVQVIRQKQERYKLLLQLSFRPFIQIHQEKHHIYYPSENYDTYTAHESAEITNYYYNNGYRVKGSRKNKTFFFNALTPDGFDRVIHPVVKEPMVQFTCYLKIKAEIDR